MKTESFSRRSFIKSTAVSSALITGSSFFAGCCGNEINSKNGYLSFQGDGFNPEKSVAGILFSQVGYEPGFPVRIVLRLPEKSLISTDTKCYLIPGSDEKEYNSGCIYWGEIWKSHWWVVEFPSIKEEGEWIVEIRNRSKTILRDNGFKVKKNILWDSTIEWSSVDLLERRRHFTKVGAGWQDAGTLWVESPAQSAMIISLAELLERKKESFDPVFLERIYQQLFCGCDYLLMTQKKAEEMGYPNGSFTHDLHGHETDILPTDAVKAVVALAKTARVLPEKSEKKKKAYKESAELAYKWLVGSAKPMGEYGYVKMQRGLTNNVKIPDDEWLTRDLVTLCWASLEIMKLGNNQAKDKAIELAAKIMDRQIKEEKSVEGFFGNFYEFDSLDHPETSWIHGIASGKKGVEFGADIGGIYPNYLMPLIELLQLFPGHEEAEKWKQCLNDFTYGYLIPACEKNPFFLVPQGIFKNEGPIWFCGTFHGTNAIYGYTAALALELADIFNEPKLKDIAYGNLQWLAGLNAGITMENLKQGCVVFSADIPEGVALPASMICHIGSRWAGTWFQTRGIICNGFSTGEQFVYDTGPKKENDGPFSLTDEDWIPHSAAWLAGLMRLR
ncbi:MAG: hypothetical protein JW833_05505 [Prolixibacteraceae bacterium]|nr:hypothetical protein [Prolixibacteraceae bacterium]